MLILNQNRLTALLLVGSLLSLALGGLPLNSPLVWDVRSHSGSSLETTRSLGSSLEPVLCLQSEVVECGILWSHKTVHPKLREPKSKAKLVASKVRRSEYVHIVANSLVDWSQAARVLPSLLLSTLDGLLRHRLSLNLNRKRLIIRLILVDRVEKYRVISRAVCNHARLELAIPLLLYRWRHGNVILTLDVIVWV